MEINYYYYYKEKIQLIIHYLIDIGFVVLPLVGYVHQYMKIKILKSTVGFSKFISFILIMAFIIRIFFWFGRHFELTILINAIFGLVMQLLLLKICVKYDKKLQTNRHISRLLNLKEFWNWPYFYDYFFFLSFITILLGLLSNLIGYENEAYVFTLGVITSMIEAFLDIPQIYELYISKNTQTISYLLIFGWLCGDIFKVSYYCSRDTPIQLIVCAIFQLSTDFVVVWQVWYYRDYINYEYDRFNDIKSNFLRFYSYNMNNYRFHKSEINSNDRYSSSSGNTI